MKPSLALETMGPPGVQLLQPGWTDPDQRVPSVDKETLASVGLLQRQYVGPHETGYTVTPSELLDTLN